jgi:hypothetical protein
MHKRLVLLDVRQSRPFRFNISAILSSMEWQTCSGYDKPETPTVSE